jgi:hypothetical protein
MSRSPRRDAASKRERKYTQMAVAECRRLAQGRGGRQAIDPSTAGTGLVALMDGFWWALMTDRRSFSREHAIEACDTYLAAIYPGYRRRS